MKSEEAIQLLYEMAGREAVNEAVNRKKGYDCLAEKNRRNYEALKYAIEQMEGYTDEHEWSIRK